MTMIHHSERIVIDGVVEYQLEIPSVPAPVLDALVGDIDIAAGDVQLVR